MSVELLAFASAVLDEDCSERAPRKSGRSTGEKLPKACGDWQPLVPRYTAEVPTLTHTEEQVGPLERARRLVRSGRRSEAEVVLEACLAGSCPGEMHGPARVLLTHSALLYGDYAAAKAQLALLEAAGQQAEHAQKLLKSCEAAEGLVQVAGAGDVAQRLSALNELIGGLSPFAVELRLQRVQLELQEGRSKYADQDISALAQHAQSTVEVASLVQLARAQFEMLGAADAARGNLVACLRYHPEEPRCLGELRRQQKILSLLGSLDPLRRKDPLKVISLASEALGATTGFHQAELLGALCVAQFDARQDPDRGLETCAVASPARYSISGRWWAAQPPRVRGTVLLGQAWALLEHNRFDESLDSLLLVDACAREAAEEEEDAELRVEEEGDSLAAQAALLREQIVRARKVYAKANAGADGTAEDTPEEEEEDTGPKDYYAILNVTRDASVQEIKSAYRKMALKWHPDKNDSPEAAKIFLDIQEALQILTDPELRRAFDDGEDVKEQAQKKTQRARDVQFRTFEVDREKGVAKVRWYDPETGEEGWMEVPIPKQEEASEQEAVRPLFRHCCLPPR